MADTVSINGIPLAIGTNSIVDEAITLPKLADSVIESLPSPTDAQVDSAVSDWLDLHPEATTTVQDGAITTAKLADGAVTDAKLANNVIPKLMGTISPSNYSTAFPTFNADFDTSIYTFSSFSYGNSWPTGGPYSTYKGTANSVLINIKQPVSTIIEQLFVDYGTIWRRYINPAYNSYPSWTAPVKATFLIDAGNYSTRLPSIKNSEQNTNYILNFAAGSTSIPADLPTSYWEGGMAALTCVDDFYNTFTYYTFVTPYKIYSRAYNRSNQSFVSEWKQVSGPSEIYVSKNQTGTGFFTNFTNACLAAYNSSMHPTVYVLDGTYDIAAELEAIVGDLDDLSASSTSICKYGIPLGGYDIVCSGNASLTFDYTGSNVYILQNMNMFNCESGYGTDPSFMLMGLHASGSNLRYLIHDDTGGNTRRNNVPIHVFKDCTLAFDNSDNASRVGAQVIGGGLGMATLIDISGCVFVQGDTSVQGTLTYHNNYYANSQSQVNIADCYFTSGGIIFGYYGSSTLQTICRVSNCSMTYGPAKREEVAGSTDNITLYAWNNELRS